MIKPKKVLLLGSGALKIGEAGEFDYSGSQAIKALKEEGIKVVLVNPNIATVQTSEGLADRIYFLPVTPFFVEKIIEKEKPDAILLSFGGQTALNCGVELYTSGVLKKHAVQVLGTPVQTIIDTEDRDLFVKKLGEIGALAPKSKAVTNKKEALEAAETLGYPVMIRCAYTLGGQGSGIVQDKVALSKQVDEALAFTGQVLIEECLVGWKEIEYEVVRDCKDNCITVCNMENFDPLGVHTGESIVVAPSQTLTNHEYHKLRKVSIDVIRHLGVVGECNIQFALDPYSDDYRIIEVNARLSRSSALASKATGYPLAFIAAKLALGYSLTEIPNSITKVTKACFEPALDYLVVKIPRWDLQKFKGASTDLGTGMKSVGEVMAIGRKFEEALQKAIRMLQVGMWGLVGNDIEFSDLEKNIRQPNDKRLFAIAKALSEGWSVDRIHGLSKIDKWFLYKLENIIRQGAALKGAKLEKDLVLGSKRLGFSDKQVAVLTGNDTWRVREFRSKNGIVPSIKQIDTLAAEFPAKTNYLYLTYNGESDDVGGYGKDAVIVLGSGAYRIGSSVEFDWCCVNTVFALRDLGYKTIMVNYNPETVSTDYDICDKLFFDELSFEVVADIYKKERPLGIILSMGGQIPNNIALKCRDAGIHILGTSPDDIDKAEDRSKFSALLDELGIDQPEWTHVTSMDGAKEFASKVGYPILVRPSYVLSGAAMSVALNDIDLVRFLGKAAEISEDAPVVVSKFIQNARELEIDAVAKDGRLVITAISEHVENAGVHSGDATIVFPPQKTYIATIRKVRKIASEVAARLNITGPFNIQFIAKDNEIKVIECNLRASRSFPFVSKVSKKNFITLATNAIMGKEVPEWISTFDLDVVGVKAPQFSFTRIKGADPILGVEMASTGEVGCIAENFREAFLTAMISVGHKPPKKGILLSLGGELSKLKFLQYAKLLHGHGYKLYATDDTSIYLNKNGINNTLAFKAHNVESKGNVLQLIEEGKVDMVINIPSDQNKSTLTDGYHIRRKSVDFGVSLITNLQVAIAMTEALTTIPLDSISIKGYDELGGL